ncbi:MAG: DUF935 domain-containing protein [Pseudomonadota bacterium]
MAGKPQLLDHRGNPVRRATLTQEVAPPSIVGVRSPISGYPADGLDPVRLAQILRAADMGEPKSFLELAETIEERDPHYFGVLGTRKRSVSQIQMTVEPASDDPGDLERAARVEAWLKRDELAEELVDILDALGKGYSFTEIAWETSSGQWQPGTLTRRDPRWFNFHRDDLTTPMMYNDHGQLVQLEGFRFIFAQMKAKSGLDLRSGLARIAAWGYLFKKFTERDWAIFTQTYGQPLRLGKFGPGATDEDKGTLFNAVANIAGDCAAVVPESMTIDFVEAGNLGPGSELYLKRADWLDQQISKAVLGQTATTDAISGGHAVSKEHRQVQEDIERADAGQLQAILNRELIRPWMQLEYGSLPAYPRLIIARPEQEDLNRMSTALARLIPLGLNVSEAEIRGKFGLGEPKPGEATLGVPAQEPVSIRMPGRTNAQLQSKVANSTRIALQEYDRAVGTRRQSKFKYLLNTLLARFRTDPPETPSTHSEGRSAALDVSEEMADRLADDASDAIGAWMERLEAMVEAAGSIEELREMITQAYPDLKTQKLADKMVDAMIASHAAGQVMALEDAEGGRDTSQ